MATKLLGAIKLVALGDLELWERNYRRGNVDAIAASIRRFGFNASIRVKGKTVYAGNHSLLALRQLKDSGQTPPENVHQSRSGDWLVQCLDISHLSEEEAIAFAVADNRASDLSVNDPEGLAALLQELTNGLSADLVSSAGYSDRDLNKLLRDLQRDQDRQVTLQEKAPALLRIEELREKWRTDPDQFWEIGPHRLLIGDATDKANVARLRGDHKNVLMVTDPPYGVNYDPSWRLRSGLNSGHGSAGTVTNDDLVDWSPALHLWEADVLYVWHGGKHAHTVANGLEGIGYDIVSQIIWAKPNFAMSRGDYHWQHEPCWYAVRKGSTHRWQGSRTESTVWSIEGGCGEETGHSTEKPLECMARPIRNNSSPGDLIVDPFLGSGTTMVAAHQLDRECRGLEIDPGYAAVILDRMSAIGVEAKRA